MIMGRGSDEVRPVLFLRGLHTTLRCTRGGLYFSMPGIFFSARRSTAVASAVDFWQGEKHRQDWLLVLAGHGAS